MARTRSKERKARQRASKRAREKGLSRDDIFRMRRANAVTHDSGEDTFALVKKRHEVIRGLTRRKRLIQLSGNQNHRCCYCGQQTWHPDIEDGGDIPHTKWNLATSEHVVPGIAGGSWGKHNIVMACRECNNTRGCETLKNFVALITGSAEHKPGKKEKKLIKKEEKRKSEKELLKQAKLFELMIISSIYLPEIYATVLSESETGKYDYEKKRKPNRCKLTVIRRRVIENKMVY